MYSLVISSLTLFKFYFLILLFVLGYVFTTKYYYYNYFMVYNANVNKLKNNNSDKNDKINKILTDYQKLRENQNFIDELIDRA